MRQFLEEGDVLCPDLYFRLRRHFGKVRVSNRGEGLVMSPGAMGGKPRVVSSGEHYSVCCPWCGDTRYRLFINHRWFEHRYMANCFNETCCTKGDSGKHRLNQLYLWLFNTSAMVSLTVRSSKVNLDDYAPSLEFVPPEGCVSLSSLPEDHEAILYIKSRGYNPSVVEKYLGVGWISEEAVPLLRSRLYIPAYSGNKLLGYQARVISEKSVSKQKYINPPGMKKSKIIYNLDNASAQNLVVICEGPIDVWSIGPAGVAIFGSDCSYRQLSIIGENFNGKDIAVALDGDASYKADALVESIRGAAARSHVFKVPMAAGEDPGDLRLELWRRIENCLVEGGKTIDPQTLKEWPSE